MKKIILSLVAITYSIAAFNQVSSTDIEWGDYTEEVVVNTSSYFTSGNQKDLYLVSKQTINFYVSDFWESLGRFYVTKYNIESLEMEYAKSFNIGSSNSGEEFIIPGSIVSRGNNIRVFSSKSITKDKVFVAYGQLIDSVGQIGDPVEIGSFVNEESKSSGKFIYPYTKDEDEVLFVMIHPMDKYKNFTFKTYPSSKEGNVYLTGWLDEDDKYVFVKYDIETEEVKVYELNDFKEDQKATGIDYSFDNDTIVTITGYYEDEGIKAKKKKALGKADGIYYSLLNTNSFEKISFEINSFDDEAREILLSEKELKKGLKPSLLTTPNFIGSSGGGGMIYNLQYQKKKYIRAKQLFFTGIDSLGKISWSSYIPINQELFIAGGLSRFHAGYDYHIIDGSLYFLYSSHVKNIPTFNSLPPEKHKTLKKEKHTVTMLSRLYSDGNVETVPLVEGEDVGEIMIIPGLTYSTDDGQLIFFSYNYKERIYEKSRIGRIQFEIREKETDDADENEEEGNEENTETEE